MIDRLADWLGRLFCVLAWHDWKLDWDLFIDSDGDIIAMVCQTCGVYKHE